MNPVTEKVQPNSIVVTIVILQDILNKHNERRLASFNKMHHVPIVMEKENFLKIHVKNVGEMD